MVIRMSIKKTARAGILLTIHGPAAVEGAGAVVRKCGQASAPPVRISVPRAGFTLVEAEEAAAVGPGCVRALALRVQISVPRLALTGASMAVSMVVSMVASMAACTAEEAGVAGQACGPASVRPVHIFVPKARSMLVTAE